MVDDSKSSCGMLRQEDCRKSELKSAGQSEFQVSPSYIKTFFSPSFSSSSTFFNLKSQDSGTGGREIPPLFLG